MNTQPVLGVIGGSGLYDFPYLEEKKELKISTPFGDPSSPIIVGSIKGKKVAFLARHGIGHVFMPGEVNYRANIYALKSLGINRVVSVSACGSLREELAPGQIVIPDQIVDLTHERARTFFGEGAVVHISVADPFCNKFAAKAFGSVEKTGAKVTRGGTYLTIEGPRFSTKGESNLYRQWGMSIIGMTASPEIFLAKEAEMCYATIAHVTDYDVWHTSEEPVTVEMVIKTLRENTEIAQQSILNLVEEIDTSEPCPCHTSLQDAIMTSRDLIPENTIKKIDLLVNKYI